MFKKYTNRYSIKIVRLVFIFYTIVINCTNAIFLMTISLGDLKIINIKYSKYSIYGISLSFGILISLFLYFVISFIINKHFNTKHYLTELFVILFSIILLWITFLFTVPSS